MVFRRFGPWSLALGVLIGIGSSTSHASGINFTGNVAKDFDITDRDIQVVNVSDKNPTAIGQSSWITNNQWVSGWSVKDIRFSYDQKTDTLSVGINNWASPTGALAPFGQANGDPYGTPTAYDPAHLGFGNPNSDKSVAVMFSAKNPNNTDIPGAPVIIAGVPADKSLNGPGTDGFNISTVDTTRSESGLGYMFGKSLMGSGSGQLNGNLAFDPSPAHPQLEFSIQNFSKVIDPAKGFWIQLYAGSGLDGVAGETQIVRPIASFSEQNIPEPTTVLAWALMAGGAAWRVRSKKRAAKA